eukprot:gene27450-36107_t
MYFNSSDENISPLQYCSRSLLLHEPSLERIAYVLYFPNSSYMASDNINWQEVVRIVDLSALSTMNANKHCNIWEVVYNRELKSAKSIFYCMRRIILDFLDIGGNYSTSSEHRIDQQFDLLLSESFHMNLDCVADKILSDSSILESIWMSINLNRTNIHLYEEDIRTMYELHSQSSSSPTLTKLMGILSTMVYNNTGAAAVYLFRSCVLSDFRDIATLLEYAYYCHSVDREMVLGALRKGFQRTEDARLLHQLLAIHKSNNHSNSNIYQWEEITMALKMVVVPTISPSLWTQYFNAGLSFFPNCPALLYMRAMQYFDSGDLPCAARLLSEALLYRSLLLSSSALVQSIFADGGVVEQNYEWILDQLNLLPRGGEASTRWANPPLPERVYSSCYPLRRITSIGRDSIHDEALRDAVEVLGLSPPSQIDCPANTTTVGDEMQGGGCLALQVGCSNHRVCARLPWVVLDAVASLSTWIHSAAYDLQHIRSASVHVLYCSHTLEHLQHYNQERSMVTLALREWNRVLVPGGRLMLAVPDMEAIARIISTQSLSALQKMWMGCIIYGGQDNPYNHHYTAFYMDFLQELLLATNFCDVERVDSFGLFDDDDVQYEKRCKIESPSFWDLMNYCRRPNTK